MYKSNYSNKLKHPFWQKKRLDIFNLHDFKCQDCGATEITLNVHHIYYEKNKEPWEYENDSLKCLCNNCHEKWHLSEKLINKYILEIKKNSSFDLLFYAGFLAGFSQNKQNPADIEVVDEQFLFGLSIYFNVDIEVIKQYLDGNILRKEIISCWKSKKGDLLVESKNNYEGSIIKNEIVIYWRDKFELLFEDGAYKDIEVSNDFIAAGLSLYFEKELNEIMEQLDGIILRKEIIIDWANNLEEGNYL